LELAKIVWLPWLLGRVVVGGTLALAHLIVTRTHPAIPGVAERVHEGLLGWDAGWYETIARVGYVPLGHQAVRFFPLFPIVSRLVAQVSGVTDGIAVVFIANLSALIASMALVALVRNDCGDGALAKRTVWLLSLAPPAFTLVMGYSEGMLLVFTTATFLAIRPARGAQPRWVWAGIFGYLAALTRPLGVLVALAVFVEALRHWRASTARQRIAASVAVLSPVAGIATFLGWSAAVFGDFFLPIRVQTSAGHHGGLADPLATLVHDARGAFHHHFGTALHVPWVLLVVVLLVICWRRLPASYGAFATGVVAAALSGTNLDSFERYALSAFPLVITGGLLCASGRVERSVLALFVSGLTVYALLAFLNLSVP